MTQLSLIVALLLALPNLATPAAPLQAGPVTTSQAESQAVPVATSQAESQADPVATSPAESQAIPFATSQTESPADPVQVIKNHVDAYNRRDLDALAATFAADAAIFILPGTEPVYAGREAIRDAYGDQLERNCLGTMGRECPDLKTRVTSWQVIGGYVVTYQLVTLVDTAPPIPYVLIYDVREGLIRNAWFLVDA